MDSRPARPVRDLHRNSANVARLVPQNDTAAESFFPHSRLRLALDPTHERRSGFVELKKGHRFYLWETTLVFLRPGFFPAQPLAPEGTEVPVDGAPVCDWVTARCRTTCSPATRLFAEVTRQMWGIGHEEGYFELSLFLDKMVVARASAQWLHNCSLPGVILILSMGIAIAVHCPPSIPSWCAARTRCGRRGWRSRGRGSWTAGWSWWTCWAGRSPTSSGPRGPSSSARCRRPGGWIDAFHFKPFKPNI